MIVLAFDIASRTGWALSAPDKPQGVVWGSFGVELGGEEGIGRGLAHFAHHLAGILSADLDFSCLAWEKPIQASRHSAVYDEFVKGAIGLLRMEAFNRGWTALPCDMKAVRAHFIGDGVRHDAKQQVWMRCQSLGYSVKNTDESDAIATWDYAVGVMKAREYARTGRGFGGSGGRALAARERPGSHRRL